MVDRWRRTRGERRAQFRIFGVREDWYVHPEREGERSFFVIEVPDWVNVIAETEDGRVLLIRQFRPGVGGVRLEIPGGVIEPVEAPAAAAARELAEETGFAGDAPELICVTEPNPALQPNRCWSFLVRRARPVGAAQPDLDEIIEPLLVDRAELARVVREGELSHALLLVPVLRYLGGAT
jgi:8-oxo-dGTP pyrophosphatase MutT (NUDIX family)